MATGKRRRCSAGWLAGLLLGVLLGGTRSWALSCAPIAPCKACHSPAAVRALAQCIAQPWEVPPAARTLKNPLPETAEVREEGRALYQVNCEGCHGTQGDGRGPVAVKFALPAVAINAAVVQAQSDGVLFWKIAHGKGAMPAWLTLLSEEDCWKLVRFIRTFQKSQ
ncbi:MAG: hypothetical protein KatS3mg131_2389 [Candidatus Tectimicrobiota bacterium]|nr:MAG: hypothetical protein KatS3mg131_2389 [Candidatus Tectomicrobia bacterium]